MPDAPLWGDPRYGRSYAVSDDPPHLGYPPVGDYVLHHCERLGLPLEGGLEQLALSQVHPLSTVRGVVGAAGRDVFERLAEDAAAHEVAKAGKTLVVPLRFWWWREDIPTLDDDEPPIPGVRMLAVGLATVDREVATP